MRKLILSTFICFSTIYAFGQQAVWNSSTNTNYVWNYIFDADKSSQEKGTIFPVPPLNNPILSVSTSKRAGFLPKTPSGVAKVAAHANKGQKFTLIEAGADDLLKINASDNSNVAKFSVYNIDQATALTATNFILNFEDNEANRTDWVFALGYQNLDGVDTRFRDGRGIPNTGFDADFFACLKFVISPNDRSKINSFYSGKNSASEPAYVPMGELARGLDNKFEILCNNTSDSQKYKKGINSYEVPAGYYQVWVNNVRLKASTNDFNFSADGLEKGKNLNSLLLTGSNSKTADVPSNDGSVLVSKLSINFTKP